MKNRTFLIQNEMNRTKLNLGRIEIQRRATKPRSLANLGGGKTILYEIILIGAALSLRSACLNLRCVSMLLLIHFSLVIRYCIGYFIALY